MIASSKNNKPLSRKSQLMKALLCAGFFILFFGVTANFAYADSVTPNAQQLQAMYHVTIMAKPDTNDMIGQVSKGAILQAIASEAIACDKSNWYEVTLDGTTGWVDGCMVQVYQPPVPAPTPVLANLGETGSAAAATQSSSSEAQDTDNTQDTTSGTQLVALYNIVNVRSGPARATRKLAKWIWEIQSMRWPKAMAGTRLLFRAIQAGLPDGWCRRFSRRHLPPGDWCPASSALQSAFWGRHTLRWK